MSNPGGIRLETSPVSLLVRRYGPTDHTGEGRWSPGQFGNERHCVAKVSFRGAWLGRSESPAALVQAWRLWSIPRERTILRLRNEGAFSTTASHKYFSMLPVKIGFSLATELLYVSKGLAGGSLNTTSRKWFDQAPPRSRRRAWAAGTTPGPW